MEIRSLVDLIYDERKNYYVVVGRCGNTLRLQNAFLHFSCCDLINVIDGKATINDGKIEVKKAVDIIEYRMQLYERTDTKLFSLEDVLREYDVEFTSEYTK